MQGLQLLSSRLIIGNLCCQVQRLSLFINHEPPAAIQKTSHTANPGGAPRLGGLQWPHEHLVEPERIGTKLSDDVVRIDHIAPTLRHLVGAALNANLGSISQHKVLALFFNLIGGDLHRRVGVALVTG